MEDNKGNRIIEILVALLEDQTGEKYECELLESPDDKTA